MTVVCPNQCGKTGLVIGVDERSIKEHITQQCSPRSLQCAFGCGAVLSPLAVSAHNDSCEYNTALCPNGCCSSQHSRQLACYHKQGVFCKPTSFLKRLSPAHIADDCPAAVGRCSRCLVSVKRCEWAVHQQGDGHQLKEATSLNSLLTSPANVPQPS